KDWREARRRDTSSTQERTTMRNKGLLTDLIQPLAKRQANAENAARAVKAAFARGKAQYEDNASETDERKRRASAEKVARAEYKKLTGKDYHDNDDDQEDQREDDDMSNTERGQRGVARKFSKAGVSFK